MTIGRNGGLLEGALTESVIAGFFAAYRELGFGYRERIYTRALERELMSTGHRVDRELPVMIYYRGEPLARQRLDMVVDERVAVEIKATERLHPDSSRQLFSYLCATSFEVGLLLHFGREPKFYRVVCENHLKRRAQMPK
jgi:GxxExxY protein